MTNFVKTVVVIPCYNVEKYCRQAVEEALQFVSHVIVVNDGSTDNTGRLLQQLVEEHRSSVHLINFQNNRGKGAALLEGFKYALATLEFDALVTIDGDGQHRAAYIPRLVEKIRGGAEMVIGERLFEHMPFRSQVGNRIISLILRIRCKQAPIDTQSGMRAFNRALLEEIIASIPEGRYETEFRCLLLALCQKRSIATITIPTIYLDKNRSSSFHVFRDAFLIFKTYLEHLIHGCRSYHRK